MINPELPRPGRAITYRYWRDGREHVIHGTLQHDNIIAFDDGTTAEVRWHGGNVAIVRFVHEGGYTDYWRHAVHRTYRTWIH